MKITALKYGESVFSKRLIFDGDTSDEHIPISFTIYLIQTEDKNILVDVGCDDGAGFEMSVFKKPVEVLKEYGLKPCEITDVIITHSHHDHIEAIAYYTNATIHIQKDEYDIARKYIPKDFKTNLIDEEWRLINRVTMRKIGGHSIGSCIVLADEYVMCGDECYYLKNLAERIVTGSSFDKQKSKEFIEEYHKNKYIPLLFHDPQILAGKVGYTRII